MVEDAAVAPWIAANTPHAGEFGPAFAGFALAVAAGVWLARRRAHGGDA